MTDLPDPYKILADHLRRLDIDPIEAANVLMEVAQAFEARYSEQRQREGMEQWRADQGTTGKQ